jgi:hypothetical protein
MPWDPSNGKCSALLPLPPFLPTSSPLSLPHYLSSSLPTSLPLLLSPSLPTSKSILLVFLTSPPPPPHFLLLLTLSVFLLRYSMYHIFRVPIASFFDYACVVALHSFLSFFLPSRLPHTGRRFCYYMHFGGCTSGDACTYSHNQVIPFPCTLLLSPLPRCFMSSRGPMTMCHLNPKAHHSGSGLRGRTQSNANARRFLMSAF